jgi:hypothetical protein
MADAAKPEAAAGGGAAAVGGAAAAAPGKAAKKRFEVKKWNAVALWAWGKQTVANSFPLWLEDMTACSRLQAAPSAVQPVHHVPTLWWGKVQEG